MIKWIIFAPLALLTIILQITLVGLIRIPIESIGEVMPDLMAAVAIFIALRGKRLADVMIAAWILGFILDLTTAGGAGRATVVGPMAVTYTLSAWVVYQIREVFFRDWIITQSLLALVFCLLAHLLWVSWQSLVARDVTTWQMFGHLVVQAGLLSAYTAIITPIIHLALKPCRKLLFTTQSSRRNWG